MWWAVALLALSGCEKEAPKPADAATRIEQASREMGDAARKADVQKMGEAMTRMGEAVVGGTQIEPVDFRELKALLPESVAGMKRTSSEGSRHNVMGIASSKAQAAYGDGKGARLDVEMMDVGTMTGVTAMAFAWLNVEIDREGDDGYERTNTLAGRKAYERYSKSARTGELDVLVAGRFVVSVRGNGLDMKSFRAAIEAIDFAKLDALKARGAPPATAKK
jgi:hypothetical protein